MHYNERNFSKDLKDYFDKTNNSEAVIGLSGGIDSAVVACLAVNALGNDAVYGTSDNWINYYYYFS